MMCAVLSELCHQLLAEIHYFIGSSHELQNHRHGAWDFVYKIFYGVEYGLRSNNELLMRDDGRQSSRGGP
nr:hypothetical protein Iba_chr15aCG13390 [Ipomoea batatas]